MVYKAVLQSLKTLTVATALHGADRVDVGHGKAVEGRLHAAVFHMTLHLGYLGRVELGARHYIELRTRRLTHGVYLIALTCCGKSTALMKVFWEYDFGVDFVARSARAQCGSLGCGARVGIAGLNHEILYYAVEECSVVVSFVDEFHEVVAVLGRVAVK